MAHSGKLNILYGEGDADVLKSQAAGIQKAGHQVQAAEGRKAVEAALKQGNYDLVVLGATLTRDDRHHLPYMVKKSHPGLRVLVLHADGGRHPYVDGNVDTGSNLETMLAKIAGMIGQNTMAKAAGR
jgi:DNA-binding NtrC family response regulator